MTRESLRRLLLIEDNRGDARLLREMLDDGGLHDTEVTLVECMHDAEKFLAESAVDAPAGILTWSTSLGSTG